MGVSLVLAILLIVSKVGAAKVNQYDSTTVLSKITNIQELGTVKYNYSGVVGYKDAVKIMNLNVPLTEKYFLLKYNGYLKAGVDFSRIKVNIDGENVHVSMPRAKIFDVVIDEKSVRVYNESENAFNPIKISDYNQAMVKEKNTMRQDAVNQGILKDANRQAELVIKSLLEEMGYKNVKFTLELTIPKPN